MPLLALRVEVRPTWGLDPVFKEMCALSERLELPVIAVVNGIDLVAYETTPEELMATYQKCLGYRNDAGVVQSFRRAV